MTNNLVRNCSIVLQDIEILGAAGLGNLLRDGLPAYISVSYVPVRQSSSGYVRDLAGFPPRLKPRKVLVAIIEFNQRLKKLTLVFTFFVALGCSLIHLPRSHVSPRRGYRSALHRGIWG